MKNKSTRLSIKPSVKLLVAAAIFSALTALFTLVFKIPVANGYIHVGDAIIYVMACVLPFPYALIAAGIGGAVADVLGGYPVYVLPTLIIKALITLPFGANRDKILTRRNSAMVIIAGLISAAGYFIADLILFSKAGALAALPGSALQASGSGLLFIIFAAPLDKAKFKQRFNIKEK